MCVLSWEMGHHPPHTPHVCKGRGRYEYLVQFVSRGNVIGSCWSLFLVSLQSEAFGAG